MHLAGAVALLALAGCGTHLKLENGTVDTAATVMEIQYQMVMDNLAHIVRSPAALPSQIRIKQGTVQVSDRWGIYNLRVSGSASGSFGGPRAERTVSEQWGADAISDPRAVKILQDLYRAALGPKPLPDPEFLDAGQVHPSPRQQSKDGSGSGGGEGGSGSGGGGEAVTALLHDVPHGWFHVGTRSRVPANASGGGLMYTGGGG